MVGLSLSFFTKSFLKYKIQSPNKPIRKIIRKQFFKQMWVCAIFSVGLLIINAIFVKKTELSYDQFELDNDKSSYKYLKKIYGARCCDIFYSYEEFEKCERCGEYHKDADLAVCHICGEKVKETGDIYEYKVKLKNYLAFVKSSSIYELPKDKKPFVRIKKILEQKYLRIGKTDKIEYVYEFYIPKGKI